jgi:hypothetical protein
MHQFPPSGDIERRKHFRLGLRLAGHIVRQSTTGHVERIAMVTRDISIGGFFAYCGEEFSHGQQLVCILEVSADQPLRASLQLSSLHPHLCLQCTARVIHSERHTEGPRKFGIGLEIEQYHVVRDVSPSTRNDLTM